MAIGRREEFGLADILTYPQVLAFVREYHEVGDARLPVLPRILLAVSAIVQLQFNLLFLP